MVRRAVLLPLVLLLPLAAALGGCDDNMARQQRASDRDGAAVAPAPLVPGTVPRGWLAREAALAAPEGPVTPAELRRGRERFAIHCTPCHGATGDGDGTVVQRGFPPAASFHAARLQGMPREHVVAVITHGAGRMPSYASRVEPADRWAIAAYVQALQLGRGGPVADRPAADPDRPGPLPEPGR